MRVTRYSEQFRADAVAMCERGDRPVRQVAVDLGLSYWTLREWVRRTKMERKSKAPRPQGAAAQNETAEQKARRLEQEVARLEREVAQLRQDREILKKAAAFFASENA